MTNNYNNSLLRALLRQDFNSFIHKTFNTINPGTKYEPNWHIELISDYLAAVESGQIRRLIINMPPRGLKSVCVSVAWPAWILGHYPAKRIMAASYSATLSVKHSLDCRYVMESDWYRQLFPMTALSKKHNQKSKFLTTKNGFRFATSVGGSATGEGGDFLIIDDPHNPVQIASAKARARVIDWFEQTFLTRLNDKNKGAIVVVMQRLHEEDLAGYLISQSCGWELLKIPIKPSHDLIFKINNKEYYFFKEEVLHRARDQAVYLERLEEEIGTQNYAAQYLQEPIPQGYSLLKLEDISFYLELPENFEYVVQSWDSAVKISENSDYSVCTSWGIKKGRYFLISMLRDRLAYPDLKEQALRLAAKYSPRYLLIEDKASGQQLIQDLKREYLRNIIPCRPKLDKITRFASVTPIFQAGKVMLPQKSQFTSGLLKELTAFPHCKNDDIVDSVSQFLQYMKEREARPGGRIRIM